MLNAFKTYAAQNRLWEGKVEVLAAVSGGVDSIVLIDLLHKTGISFRIAHCNFSLRGEESDGDEDFVRSLADKYDVKFHSKKFDTSGFSLAHSISVQMAAREMRYEWFNELCEENELQCTATAHHNDDNVETFFINLIRGTGLRGLTGMNPVSGNVIRPLLFASKEEISAYAHENELNFREDSSNADDKYDRNNIRHNIIPELVKLNPRFAEAMRETMDKLSFSEDTYLEHLQDLKDQIIEEGETIKISIAGLVEQSLSKHLLFELLVPYGFSGADADDILGAIDGESGKQFMSRTHRLIKDRDFLLINRLSSGDHRPKSVTINEGTTEISSPISLSFKMKSGQGLSIPKSETTACLDLAKLKFPLTLRAWKPGDSIYPLGMQGQKKLSDIFIDKKIPLNEKENIFVLESDGKIAWVVGHKIDDRYKITEATEQVCLIELVGGC